MERQRGSSSRSMVHAVESTQLADLLERILDKGIVISGDIKVKIVDVELLSIEIRLLICSVDKAREIGLDWWVGHPAFDRRAAAAITTEQRTALEDRLAILEADLQAREQQCRQLAAPEPHR